MNEETFQRKLAELIAEIATTIGPDDRRIQEKHTELLKTTVSRLQESIDFIRLSVKYMLFDLEATRRENVTLRRMLEEGPAG